MKAWFNQNFLIITLGMYFILWLSLHGSLGYLMDSDAVAYLTIAHRVADGEWLKSVNGLWSPLNSWLLVPFIKMGCDSWFTAKVLNCFFGGVLLLQSWFFFSTLNCASFYKKALTFALVPIICYYVYFQMFGDVLQLIFAMGYVQLFIKEDFYQNKKWVLLAAVVMGIGFYAKAYSLIFFLAHFSVIGFLAFRKASVNRKAIVINYSIGLFAILLIVLPWSFQLQKKYGEFSLTGMAGKLNMSWYINSGKTFNDSIQLLIPPAYEDSPSFWEDPYLSAGELATPLSSGYHFKRWVLRVGHTCLMAVKSTFEISFLYALIIIVLLIRMFKKRKLPEPYLSILLAVLILPLGYLAMHIETRYIWLSTFLVMALGIYLIKEESKFLTTKQLVVILIILFMLYPVYNLIQLAGKNKELFTVANEFKKANIQGNIVSNINDEGSLWVISYLAGLNNYTIEQSNYSLDQLVKESKRLGVRQYLHYPGEGGNYSEDDELFKHYFKKVQLMSDGKSTLYVLED